MDWVSILVSGVTGLLTVGLGGTFLRYIIFPRITKRTEQAGADSSVLTNIEKVTDLQGKALVKVTEEKILLSEENSKLMAENYELKRKNSEYDFEIQNLKRVTSGIQKSVNSFAGRLMYAEHNICLNTPCEDRIPTIGTYRQKDENETSLTKKIQGA